MNFKSLWDTVGKMFTKDTSTTSKQAMIILISLKNIMTFKKLTSLIFLLISWQI